MEQGCEQQIFAQLAPLDFMKLNDLAQTFGAFTGHGPACIASTLFGFLLTHFLHSEPMNALVVGGVSMCLAALLTLLVVSFKGAGSQLSATGGH